MGHNFDIILPGNGWFSSKLNKTYCSLVNFYCKLSENGSVFGQSRGSHSVQIAELKAFLFIVQGAPKAQEAERANWPYFNLE